MSCDHTGMIEADMQPQMGRDTNVMVVSFRIRCTQCGPLRFLGIDAGISLERPCTSTDGNVLHLPVLGEFEEPESERMAS